MKQETIKGFSKLSKEEKIQVLEGYLGTESSLEKILGSFWHKDSKTQEVFDEFSENTLSNFYLPFGVAPNFLINNEFYMVPMVIEESSVVAAASKAAKFWSTRGGFRTEVLGTVKNGQIHIFWNGPGAKLLNLFSRVKENLVNSIADHSINMNKRGGGLLNLEIKDMSHKLENYFQVIAKFETCDAMGANYINTCLETIGEQFQSFVSNEKSFSVSEKEIEINMCILSNFTPECIVRAWVECPIKDLDSSGLNMDALEFAKKFKRAVDITKVDEFRATTHNKGLFNGVDSVALATGNDFRAIEACGHAYAARNGQYQGLSHVELTDTHFKFTVDLPLALGTVGGLTTLHPLVKVSFDMLGNPNAKTLMSIMVSTGLAQNFAAIKSLVTTGIQKGHMKMHLLNILHSLGASEEEKLIVRDHFSNRSVSYTAVRDCLNSFRSKQ